jgi:anaerobic C4-dicarboxylate transporter
MVFQEAMYMALVGIIIILSFGEHAILILKINPKSIAKESKFHIILLYHIFQLLRVKWGSYG